MNPSSTHLTLSALLQQARQLAQSGATTEAARLYEQILTQAPDNADALDFMGMQALGAGKIPQGLDYFQRALQSAPQNAATWQNLALAQASIGKFAPALEALDHALQIAPLFPAACLNKGAVLEQLGQKEEALKAYLQALGQAEQTGLDKQTDNLPPRLGTLLQRARTITYEARKRWIYSALEPLRDAHGAAALSRVDRCLESHFSANPERPQHPLHYPTFLFFPGLPERGWFDRADFPWLEKVESRTNEIRQELGSVLGGDEGFRPFVEMPKEHAGADYWRAVNQSPNWNAFFFYCDGERYEENCRRCPVTAEALDSIPISRVAEHSPEAFFSVLKPGVHIPAHTGVVNTRLVTHLPLVIPPDCGIRVNGEARGWNEGECIVFDDTFEHEAWNRSDTTRVVLIFDIWNPYLSEVEQEAMRLVIEGFSDFRHAHSD